MGPPPLLLSKPQSPELGQEALGSAQMHRICPKFPGFIAQAEQRVQNYGCCRLAGAVPRPLPGHFMQLVLQ